MLSTAVNETDVYVQLLVENQRRLQTYIRAIAVNHTAVEDILAETNAVLWQKRANFELGTDFIGFALRVAYFQILAYQKKRRQDRHVFAGELLEKISDTATGVLENIPEKQLALIHCRSKLRVDDRKLLNLRYESGMPVQEIARRSDRTSNAVAQALFRIRSALTECIKRTLETEGTT